MHASCGPLTCLSQLSGPASSVEWRLEADVTLPVEISGRRHAIAAARSVPWGLALDACRPVSRSVLASGTSVAREQSAPVVVRRRQLRGVCLSRCNTTHARESAGRSRSSGGTVASIRVGAGPAGRPSIAKLGSRTESMMNPRFRQVA